MTAVSRVRVIACSLAWALLTLPALAGGWDAREGRSLASSGFVGPDSPGFGDGGLLVDGRLDANEAWEADPGSCVLATVFDAVDGVEHVGTGAWVELETSVDHARRKGLGRSAWGVSLSDWHHEASFWLVRSGTREGVVLASGGARTQLIPLDVARTRSYLLVADETGAQLSVDGEPVASLPLARRRSPGPPSLRIGAGGGRVRASLASVDHGCLRPVATRSSRSPDGSMTVALLGHEGFRPALEIEPGSLRISGREAALDLIREADANGDGLLDLVVELPLELSPAFGAAVPVDATNADGQRLRGWSAR